MDNKSSRHLTAIHLPPGGPGGRVPRWVALGGGAICGVGAALFLGLLGVVVGMAAAGPGALPGTMAMAWLGFGVWRRG